MDVISLSIELGKAIQEDERYLNFNIASQKNDEDEMLQKLIGEFNLKKLAINNEVSKKEKNEEKIKSLNEELKKYYAQIMENENMKNYQEKKQDFDKLINKVNKIVSGASLGEDPASIALDDESSFCSGNCNGCRGCH